MSMIHDAITKTLAALPARPLAAPKNAPTPESFSKAGILLFLPAQTTENWRFCVMKPHAKHAALGAPPFQLPKGTRMRKTAQGWIDLDKKETAGPDAEPLAATALREAVEEVGLMLSNLTELWDAGPAEFASATTGRPKWMWLFAGELRNAENFLPLHDLAKTTAAREMLTLAELSLVREDQASIIRATMHQLFAHHRL